MSWWTRGVLHGGEHVIHHKNAERAAEKAAEKATGLARQSSGRAIRASSASASSVSKLTVKALRDQARQRGLPVSGTKSDLIGRLYGEAGSGAGNRLRMAGESLGQKLTSEYAGRFGAAFTGIGALNAFRDSETWEHGAVRAGRRLVVGAIPALAGGAIGWLGAARAGNAIQLGGALLAGGIIGASEDRESGTLKGNIRGFGRGLVQGIDLSGLVGKPLLVDAYDRATGAGRRKPIHEKVYGSAKGTAEKIVEGVGGAIDKGTDAAGRVIENPGKSILDFKKNTTDRVMRGIYDALPSRKQLYDMLPDRVPKVERRPDPNTGRKPDFHMSPTAPRPDLMNNRGGAGAQLINASFAPAASGEQRRSLLVENAKAIGTIGGLVTSTGGFGYAFANAARLGRGGTFGGIALGGMAAAAGLGMLIQASKLGRGSSGPMPTRRSSTAAAAAGKSSKAAARRNAVDADHYDLKPGPRSKPFVRTVSIGGKQVTQRYERGIAIVQNRRLRIA